MKILLIAGHGAGDPGASGCGCKEATLTRELAKLVQAELKPYCTCDLYNTARNAYTDVQTNKFTLGKYDYVFEIHFNAFNGNAHGTEIHVTPAEKSIGVEKAVIAQLAKYFTNRGVKRTSFSVIQTVRNRGVSSALLETCFIDNAADMKVYKAKKKEIAKAIATGIVQGFGLKKTTSRPAAKKKTYAEFKKQVLGKGYDIDKAFGNQCWDGYAQYCKYLGVPYHNCVKTGYVADLYDQLLEDKNFERVYTLKAGDVVVFKRCNATPLSHVAIFDSAAGAARGNYLGQNQGAAGGVFNIVSLPDSATYYYAFRPKALK